ncbi:lecithin retinol acyltransferase family protein [Oscillatoria sp. CS-180]|uniref:lecithin retinol acyltransferase family protein n=1 Tax=Oscillatoria sp. CS-180 TaxID=3021720 RepID=UPI00232CAFFA|nr:lecithin retinol acyltransferase family protein [Oscillatoria sp. CS-180]MDB9525350.1 lecithin retinol acyltransferase family protein [Oscillatoria sp. CS-180]
MALGDQVYAMREAVGVPGVYEHHGIDCGDDSVIHYYKGGDVPTVTKTPRDLFARGGRIFVKSQPTAFLPQNVVQRAESRLGEQKYDFFTNNCEHFATWSKTGHSTCEQLAAFGLQLDRYRLPDMRTLIEGTARDRSPEEAIALFRRALGNISTAHETLKSEYDRAKEEMLTWQHVAEEALRRDREDLARAALHRKVAAKKKSEKLTQQLAELIDIQLSLERNRRVSENQQIS